MLGSGNLSVLRTVSFFYDTLGHADLELAFIVSYGCGKLLWYKGRTVVSYCKARYLCYTYVITQHKNNALKGQLCVGGARHE